MSPLMGRLSLCGLCLVALLGVRAAADPIGAGTYGYITATDSLVLYSAGPTVYVGFDGRPMSIFFRSDVRSTPSGDVTQLRFLIRKTSSNIQEYSLLRCDVGQFGNGSDVPCSTAGPRDTLKHGMSFGGGAAGSIATIVLPFPANPLIQLADGSWGPGEAGFYSADQLTLTVPSTYTPLISLDAPFTRYVVLPPPSPPPSPSTPPLPPPQPQSYYTFSAAAKSYADAQADCASQGWRGHLVSIANQTENDYVFNTFCSTVNCWIGLHKVDVNGVAQWSWFNDGLGGGVQTLFDFDNFHPAEPKTGDCAIMRSAYGGQWRDLSTCTTPFAYVCEYKDWLPPHPPPPPPPPTPGARPPTTPAHLVPSSLPPPQPPQLPLPSSPPAPPLLLSPPPIIASTYGAKVTGSVTLQGYSKETFGPVERTIVAETIAKTLEVEPARVTVRVRDTRRRGLLAGGVVVVEYEIAAADVGEGSALIGSMKAVDSVFFVSQLKASGLTEVSNAIVSVSDYVQVVSSEEKVVADYESGAFPARRDLRVVTFFNKLAVITIVMQLFV